MGIADIIPGVSGGTIAFIAGIYERFLNALKSFDVELVGLISKGQFKKAAQHIDFPFLSALLAGIGTGILLFSGVLKFLLEDHPILINSFFFGLILGVSSMLLRGIGRLGIAGLFWLTFGIVVSWCIINLSSFALEPTPIGYFFAGFMAILAMILPGISGSLILYIIGMYSHVIDLVHELKSFNFSGELVLDFALFATGAVISILLLSRFISFLYTKFTYIVTVFFTGFIIGSLSKIWPWHESEDLGENLLRLPELSQSDDLIATALGCMVLGLIVVMGIDALERKLKRS